MKGGGEMIIGNEVGDETFGTSTSTFLEGNREMKIILGVHGVSPRRLGGSLVSGQDEVALKTEEVVGELMK